VTTIAHMYEVERDGNGIWRVKRAGRYVGQAFGYQTKQRALVEVGRLTRRAERLSRDLSVAQLAVINDDAYRLLGFDMVHLPVVASVVHDQVHRWAVRRDGRLVTPSGDAE